MKVISGLDDRPKPLEESTPDVIVAQMPSFRQLFKAALGMSMRSNEADAIDLYHIGMKIKEAKDDVQLEDAEFEKVKQACSANPAQWIVHYHAQVMLKLKESVKP